MLSECLAFPKNDGLRLDCIFAIAPLAVRCTSAEIERQERKGEKPSNHAPVIVAFDYPVADIDTKIATLDTKIDEVLGTASPKRSFC